MSLRAVFNASVTCELCWDMEDRGKSSLLQRANARYVASAALVSGALWVLHSHVQPSSLSFSREGSYCISVAGWSIKMLTLCETEMNIGREKCWESMMLGKNRKKNTRHAKNVCLSSMSASHFKIEPHFHFERSVLSSTKFYSSLRTAISVKQ